MHAFDILGDPRRRRFLELLADGEQTSGAITDVIRAEFGLSQPAVSQHLRVLRDSGFASVRDEGARRFYTVEPAPLREVDAWLDRFRRFWEQRLDALETELARGRRAARTPAGREPSPPAESGTDADKADPFLALAPPMRIVNCETDVRPLHRGAGRAAQQHVVPHT